MRRVPFDPKSGYPVGPRFSYRCMSCSETVPSQPTESMGCKCGNVFIDVDYGRISVKRDDDVELLESAAARM